jgi:uncharacterized protein YdeI (YjbR/CyaY-like superfamily)
MPRKDCEEVGAESALLADGALAPRTRAAHMNKYVAQILAGKGLKDE